MARVEVGLPRESFAGIRATEAFYLRNGFEPLGPRMRRMLLVSEDLRLLMVEQRHERGEAAPCHGFSTRGDAGPPATTTDGVCRRCRRDSSATAA